MIRFVALLCALLACLCAAPSFAGGIVVRQRIIQPRVIRQRVVVAPSQALLVAPQRQTLILQQPAVQQLVVPQPSQQLLIIR